VIGVRRCARTGIVGADQCVCPILNGYTDLTDIYGFFIVGTASCRLIVNATSCRYKLHGAQATLTSSSGTFQVWIFLVVLFILPLSDKFGIWYPQEMLKHTSEQRGCPEIRKQHNNKKCTPQKCRGSMP